MRPPITKDEPLNPKAKFALWRFVGELRGRLVEDWRRRPLRGVCQELPRPNVNAHIFSPKRSRRVLWPRFTSFNELGRSDRKYFAEVFSPLRDYSKQPIRANWKGFSCLARIDTNGAMETASAVQTAQRGRTAKNSFTHFDEAEPRFRALQWHSLTRLSFTALERERTRRRCLSALSRWPRLRGAG